MPLDNETAEATRLHEVRRYYEQGCACIASGQLQAMPATASDADAIEAYEAGCQCSRNAKK